MGNGEMEKKERARDGVTPKKCNYFLDTLVNDYVAKIYGKMLWS